MIWNDDIRYASGNIYVMVRYYTNTNDGNNHTLRKVKCKVNNLFPLADFCCGLLIHLDWVSSVQQPSTSVSSAEGCGIPRNHSCKTDGSGTVGTTSHQPLSYWASISPWGTTAPAHQTLQTDWPKTKWVHHGQWLVFRLIHEHHSSVRRSAHSGWEEGEKESDILPWPKQCWIPTWWSLGRVIFIPYVTNRIGDLGTVVFNKLFAATS